MSFEGKEAKGHWAQVLVALITVLGSLGVAWITAGAKFKTELTSNEGTVEELKTRVGQVGQQTAQLETKVGEVQQKTALMTAPRKRWVMLYENDKNGNPVNGDKAELIEAVESGNPIRFGYRDKNGNGFFEAQWLAVRDGEVYAQNTSHISIMWDTSEERLKHQGHIYHWFVLISTQGERDMVRWSVGEDKDRGSNRDRVSVMWFAEAAS